MTMATRRAQIQIDTTADTTGAKQAAAAMQNVNASTAAASTGTRQVGQVAAQAGFQVQDFAVQVGAGTSALTAFAQQAPQLLGVFGPTGALAGALVAVGAVATKIFLDMSKGAEDAGKAADELAEKLADMVKAASADEVARFTSALEQQTATMQGIRQAELGLTDARNKRIAADQQLLKGQQDLTAAAIEYLGRTGQITNAEERLAELRRATAEEQKRLAIAEIEAGVQAQRAQYEAIRAQKQDIQEEVASAEKRINDLQTQQARLTQELNRTRAADVQMVEIGAQAEGYESTATRAAASQLAGIEKQITDLFKFIDAAPERLAEVTAQAYEQGYKIDQAVEAARIQVEAIEQQFATEQKTATIREAVSRMGTAAQEIQQEIENLQPIGAAQAAAKETLMRAVQDGQITADEQQQVAQSLQTLLGTLRTGQGVTQSTLRELISLVGQLVTSQEAANREIAALRARSSSLIPIR